MGSKENLLDSPEEGSSGSRWAFSSNVIKTFNATAWGGKNDPSLLDKDGWG